MNALIEEYCITMQLPPEKESILREYFCPASEICKREKETMYGLFMSDDEVLEDRLEKSVLKCLKSESEVLLRFWTRDLSSWKRK